MPTASPSSISVNRAMATPSVGARRAVATRVPTLRRRVDVDDDDDGDARRSASSRRAARAMSSAAMRRRGRARDGDDGDDGARVDDDARARETIRAPAWTTPARRTYARERGRASGGGKNRPRANDEVRRGRRRRGEATGRTRETRGTDDETGARERTID